MDDCVLRPTQGLTDQQTKPDDMPWLERKQTKKRFRAFFATVGRGMIAPARLMRTLDHFESKPWSAVWFSLINMIIALMGSLGILMLIGFAFAAGSRASGAGYVIGGFIFMSALTIIGWYLFIFIWAGIAHLLIRITGNSHRSYSHTVEAIAYASAPNISAAIPCLGMYLIPVATVWWSVTAVLAVRERRQISGWRASLAVLPVPVLIIAAIFALTYWSIASTMSMSRQFANIQQPTNQLNGVYAALQDYLYQNKATTYPDHAAQLFRADNVNQPFINNFITYLTINPINIPVGSGNLANITNPNTNPNLIDQFINEAIDNLPDNAIAYRFGEIVFTWKNLDPNDTKNPNLWIAMIDSTKNTPAKPDLIANDPTWKPQNVVFVLQEDGIVIPIPTSSFSILHDNQNDLRASLNLPLLPDPEKITQISSPTQTTNDH